MIFSADFIVHCSLSLSCLVGGRSESDSDRIAENRLDDDRVEDEQHFLRQVELSQLMQKVQNLLGFDTDRVYVGGPLQVLGDCGTQKLE